MAKTTKVGYLCVQGYPNRICSGCTSVCDEPVYVAAAEEPDPVEPATSFWEGYKRPPETVDEVVEAMRVAMYAHPNQRIGQLLVNIFGNSLFNVWDEDLAKQLRGD